MKPTTSELIKAAEAIITKTKISRADRLTLLSMYNVAYHESGKIDGIFSLDSAYCACDFCHHMTDAATNDPRIICGYCYDKKQEAYRKCVGPRHALNARIMSSVLFTVAELRALNIIPGAIVRFNSSGDLLNETMLENYIRICKAFPKAHFALWTKRGGLLDSVLDLTGKPRNLRIAQSSILINHPCKPSKYTDIVFTVYLEESDVQKAIARGEIECNGQKCKACGFQCYLKLRRTATGPVYVAEILRGVSKARKAIVREYDIAHPVND